MVDSSVFSCRLCGIVPKNEGKVTTHPPIVSTKRPLLLLGAGPIDNKVVNGTFLKAESCVCADGGLKHAISSGISPQLVVGDFDSVDPPTDIPVYHSLDQNFTDFEKTLAVINAPVILAVGFLGGRLDHQLAAFSTLLKTDQVVILIDDTHCMVHVPARTPLSVPITAGQPVALYPLLSVRVTTRGVVWPLTDAVMAPDGLTSTSNHMATDHLYIETNGPGVLAILPYAALDDVINWALTLAC